MTRDNRRKKIARAYQAAHGSDYTEARRATEQSPRGSRRKQAAATLAVRRGDVCTELLRVCNTPARGRVVHSLVEAVLEKIDGVPPQQDETEGGQLWNVVMDGGWGTTARVDSADIHAVADFIRTLIDGLDDQQLVTAATELGITERDVNYFSKKAYEIAPDESGRPRLVGAIISRRPGASAEVDAKAEQVAAIAREHLRDTSARSWVDYDREVLRQAVLQVLASVGDAYLQTSEPPEVRALVWRRLPDGSMRADVNVADSDATLSALIKAIAEDDRPIWSPALGSEFYTEFCTEFYPTGRCRDIQSYMCYVGIFDGNAVESASEARVFEELYSSGPCHQLVGQKTAARTLAEVLTDV